MRNIISTLTLLTTITLHAQVPSYVPTNGLVGWWPFNGNANDESGNGNHGTVNGAAYTTDRLGNTNAASSFYGANDYIEIPTTSGQFDSQEYTISFWLRTSSQSSPLGGNNINPAILSRLNIGGPNANPPTSVDNFVIYEIGGGLLLNTNNVGDGGIGFNSISNNIWHNIIFTKNSSGAITTYFNGAYYANQNNTGTFSFQIYPIRIGRSRHTYWKDYTGEFDDLGFWNRALTPAEVQALYSAQSTPCVSPTAVSFGGLSTSYTTNDGPATLTGTPAGGVFIGPGVTGSTFSPAVAGEGTHSISYTYLDGNNCVNTFSLCTSVALGMGVEPGGNALGGVRVFPNPNRGQFIVELELSGLVSLQVFDARGALVHNEVFTASGARTRRTLDLSAFAKGSYTLQVQNNGGRVSQTVVVE